jgi:hypothetical protein
VSKGRAIPGVTSVLTNEAVEFAIEVIDSSGLPEIIEDLLAYGRCWSPCCCWLSTTGRCT